MTKDVGTQTDNTLFQLLDHDCLLYHAVWKILELKIRKYSTQIQELKKEICFLKLLFKN